MKKSLTVLRVTEKKITENEQLMAFKPCSTELNVLRVMTFYEIQLRRDRKIKN